LKHSREQHLQGGDEEANPSHSATVMSQGDRGHVSHVMVAEWRPAAGVFRLLAAVLEGVREMKDPV